MKKILTLMLMAALAAVLCVSCAGKDEDREEALVTYTIYNFTDETITTLSMSDTRSKNKTVLKDFRDGEIRRFSMTAVVENNTPSLTLTFTTESSQQYTTKVFMRESPIILLPIDSEGEIVAFTEPKV